MTDQIIYNLFNAMQQGRTITVRGLLSKSGYDLRFGDPLELRTASELVASVWSAILFKGYSKIYIDGAEVQLTDETKDGNAI